VSRFGKKQPEYRDHIISTRRERDHWVSSYALPDHTTPEYCQPTPYPKCRSSGGFLHGPYKSEAEAYEAALRAVDENHRCDDVPRDERGSGTA
jgi:hypothetical protein